MRHFTHLPSTPPRHVGPPLRVGETALLRRPDTSFDLKVELRGIDGAHALVRMGDATQRVVAQTGNHSVSDRNE